MNPNSDLNNESVMAANAESSTIKTANAESRISEYAARFAAYSDERLKQTVDPSVRFVVGAASAVTSSPPCEESARSEDLHIAGKCIRGLRKMRFFCNLPFLYANYVAFSIFLCNFATHKRER